jgi:hypothetical protein
MSKDIRTQILRHAIPVSYLELLPCDILLLLGSIWTDPKEILKLFEASSILKLKYWIDENGEFWQRLYFMYIRSFNSNSSTITFSSYLYDRVLDDWTVINHEDLSIRDLYLKVMGYYQDQDVLQLIRYGAYNLFINVTSKTLPIDDTIETSSKDIAKEYVAIFKKTIDDIVIMEYIDLFDFLMAYCDMLPIDEVSINIDFHSALESAAFFNNHYLFNVLLEKLIVIMDVGDVNLRDNILNTMYMSYYNFMCHYELDMANLLLDLLRKYNAIYPYMEGSILDAVKNGNIRGIEYALIMDKERYKYDDEQSKRVYSLVVGRLCLSGKLDTIKYFLNQLVSRYGLLDDIIFDMFIYAAASHNIEAFDTIKKFLDNNKIYITDHIYMIAIRYAINYDRYKMVKHVLQFIDRKFFFKHLEDPVYGILEFKNRDVWLEPLIQAYKQDRL